MVAPRTIVGLILAGGRGRRLGGVDKAFVDICGRPMIGFAIERLRPQVSAGLLISANGDPARFEGFGLPVVADCASDFSGPLSGVLAGLDWIKAHRPEVGALVSVSTDAPLFPADLVERLAAVSDGLTRAAVAASAGRVHPVIALWPAAAAEPIAAALAAGERRVMSLIERLSAVTVEFPANSGGGQTADPLLNVNTREDLAHLRLVQCGSAVPVLGVAGFKNSGKTHLVCALVTELSARGFRIATVKNSHHAVPDPVAPGTDTERHRAAGAAGVALVAANGWGVVPDFHLGVGAPALPDVIAALPPCNLVIVEGFKRAPIAKIEVRRRAAPAEPLAPGDPRVVAIAADHGVSEVGRPAFALDNVRGLADFVVARFAL